MATTSLFGHEMERRGAYPNVNREMSHPNYNPGVDRAAYNRGAEQGAAAGAGAAGAGQPVYVTPEQPQPVYTPGTTAPPQ
jgi:hypothetical protein